MAATRRDSSAAGRGRLVVLHEAARESPGDQDVSAVAATAAAEPPCAAPTSPAATLVHADACSRSTADAALERAPNGCRFRPKTGSC
jgi:hypothetical protein